MGGQSCACHPFTLMDPGLDREFWFLVQTEHGRGADHG
jgi:hypothetical protein